MHSDAYREIQRLLDLLPNSINDILRLSENFVAHGEWELAVELLRRASVASTDSGLRIALGVLFGRMGRHKDAMSQMMQVLKHEPENGEALLQMAASLYAIKESARAEQMLEKALQNGVGAERVAAVRYNRLADEDRTRPDAIPSDVDVHTPVAGTKLKAGRERKGTALGAPLSHQDEDVIPTNLPKIPPRSINNLNAYDGADAGPAESMLQEVPGLDQDADFDQLLSDMGVPIDEPAPIFVAPEPPPPAAPHPPPPMQRNQIAGPEDHTTALVLDEAVLGASDVTAAISFDDHLMSSLPAEEIRLPTADSAVPSVEYDEGFAAEISEPQYQVSDYAEHNLPEDSAPLDLGPDFPEIQQRAPAQLRQPQQQPQPVQPQPMQPQVNSWDQGQQQQNARVPQQANPAPMRLQPAAVRAAHSEPTAPQKRRNSPSDESKSGSSNKTKLAIGAISVAGVFFLLLAIVAISTISEKNDVGEFQTQATEALKPDTYMGYLHGKRALSSAVGSQGLIGISLPGAKGTELRDNARADLALVGAVLSYRFGEDLKGELPTLIQSAPAADPRVGAARVYQLLIENRPHDALVEADKEREKFPNQGDIEQARVESMLALHRLTSAEESAEVLRQLPSMSIAQKLSVARVDLSKSKPKAARTALKAIIEESPKHIDARIQLALAQLAMKEPQIKKAKATLKEVLEGDLRTNAAPYQVAKATAAMGRVHLAEKDTERAEVKFRDAIRLLPSRSDFYLPLLKLYADKGRFDDFSDYLGKALEAKVDSLELQLLDAEYRIRTSRSSEAVLLLQKMEFEDTRKAWLLGLAQMDLDKTKEAIKTFDAGAKLADAPPRMAATAAMLRILGDPQNEDADYVLKKLRDEHPEDGWTAWASARVKQAAAKRSRNKKTRTKGLRSARKDIKKAISSTDVNERFYFLSCVLHLEGSNGKSAETDCVRGRKANSQFVPGAVTFAKLRRFQGQYKEATEVLTKVVSDHPSNTEASLELARVHIAAGDASSAEALVNKWIGRGVNESDLNLLQGRVAFARQQYTKAAGYLQKAYEAAPTDGESLVYYGWTLAYLGNFEEAGKRLLDAIPDSIWGGYAWMVLGEVRRRQNRLKDAFANFRGASKSFSANDGPRIRWSTLYALRALAHRDKHDWNHPLVIKQLEMGRDKGEPDDPELLWVWALYEIGKKQPDLNAASTRLERLSEVSPTRCLALETWKKVLKNLEDKGGLKKATEVHDKYCGKP